ncbi:hypothetical protein DFP72DRAFT_813928 [Ephemerocybe angulata]|uniref:F-box domain-containing protein n=1 Tax=Ephemerocybe angulata TaxID=980116 RepID=A0A8H6HXR2_9AGAR|nr:hypothetical protein DFP72DRAFT_813928 [Tulosesus angulatus]
MELSTLPPELLIHVISYLELPSLTLIPLLSKAFRRFFTEAQNEVVIWRNVCVLHGLVYTSSKDGSNSEPPRREWGRWRDWKANFVAGIKHRVEVHRSWCGELPSIIGKMLPSVRNLRRIKVDERNGFFLTTQANGGLIVSDISTSHMLWCTPRIPAHQSAELEYDQGYAIIPRPDGSKEVWRSRSIPSTAGIPATYTPDLHQRVASALANGREDDVRSVSKKHEFVSLPAGLRPSGLDHSFRSLFVYPYLIASSQSQVYIWDVRTGEEIQTVASIQRFTVPQEHSMGATEQLGERWIFVAGREGLRVFARGAEFFDAGGPNSNFAAGQIVLRIPSDKMHYSRWNVIWNKEVDWMSEEGANTLPIRDDTLGEPKLVRRRVEDKFFVVRISPDQKHLVAMLVSSRLLFIPYFERVISGEASLWDVAIDIQLGGVMTPTRSSRLSVTQFTSCIMQRSGIFIVTPYFTGRMKTSTSSATRDPTREVDITVHRLAPSFMDPYRLSQVDSLEMSDSGIWIDWITSKPSPPVNPFYQGDLQHSCRFPGKVPDWLWKQAFDLAADDPESKKEILAATIPDHWRKSIEYEARFRDSLKKWRVSQAGIPGEGVYGMLFEIS